MGFSRNLFIGNQEAYQKYMKIPEDDISLPETIKYIVGGVNCPEGQGDIQECAIKDYRIHGGDCQDGISDMFIVCATEKKIIPGQWGEWQMTSPCRPWEDYYSQGKRAHQVHLSSKHGKIANIENIEKICQYFFLPSFICKKISFTIIFLKKRGTVFRKKIPTMIIQFLIAAVRG
jgi:hypothetical protein